jgi:hypothetical protein
LKDGVFNFSSSITNAYQQISIPTSLFGINGIPVTTVRFTVSGPTGPANIGFYMGDITLQGGTVNPTLPSNLMLWAGIWNATASYVVNDVVVSNGVPYLALVANGNTAVTNTTVWQQLANSVGTCTVDGVAYYNSTNGTTCVAPPTTNGLYQIVHNITGSAAAAPQAAQVGLNVVATSGATNSYTVAYTDCEGQAHEHDAAGSASVAITLPTATTLGNPSCVFEWTNYSTHTDTITPTTWTIGGNSSQTVPHNASCRMSVDPAGTNWLTKCVYMGTSSPGSGTVTSIATTSPITGGTITTTGTIGCATCAIGPGSSTANHLATFANTDGLTLADGGAIPTGTVTSIATSSPLGGGTITTTGTLTCSTCVTSSSGGAIPTSAAVLTSTSAPNLAAALQTDVNSIGYVAGGGTHDAQTATLSPAITGYTNGFSLCWLPTAANTGTTPTLAVNGLTAKTIVKAGGAALVASDLTTTAIACAIYDGTYFELQNPQTTAAAGYSTIDSNGTAVTQRSTVNFIPAGSANVACVDNSGATRTDCTVTGINGPPSPAVNVVSGSSYTIQNSDNTWRDKFTNAGAVAVTLPQAGTITSSPYVRNDHENINGCTNCASSANTLSANHLILAVASNNGDTTHVVQSITDTAGNTYFKCAPDQTTVSYSLMTWCAYNSIANASNVTTFHYNNSGNSTVIIAEYNIGTNLLDHSCSATGNPIASCSISLTNTDEVSIAFDTYASSCPAGWTQRAGGSLNQLCEQTTTGVATSTYATKNNGGAVNMSLLGFGIAGISSFNAGWFVILENDTTNLVTVTPTTSTINGRTTLVLAANESCEVMSDGTNYQTTWCGFVPNLTTNGVMGGKVEVAGVNTAAANSDQTTTTLFTTGATDAFFEVNGSIACHTSTSTGTSVLTITYTDTSNTVQTLASGTAACTTLGSSSVSQVNVLFRAKASTNIQYGFAHGGTQPTVDVSVAVYQLSTQ